MDESYFGPRRVKGKRGRGASRKTIVFGIFKRNGKVYTEIVPNATTRTLQAIVRGKVDSRSIIHSDSWRGYDGVVDVDSRKDHRVHHGDNVFARGRGIHINGIESFWGTAKTRLAKRRGIRPHLFYLHLKECECRFHHRHDNLYQKLLEMFRQEPLRLNLSQNGCADEKSPYHAPACCACATTNGNAFGTIFPRNTSPKAARAQPGTGARSWRRSCGF